ncbi:MAG: S9 family peptidase [Pseudomonadota bacterium]|nr:S9 family peptidase [Pseudomonadota bacterium]
MSTTAPYGAWRSPITSDLIAGGAVRFSSCKVAGDKIFWLESRPAQGGRNALVFRNSNGAIADITPPNFNVRTRAHEYGGGAFAVDADGVYFCNDADQRIYRQAWGEMPVALTPAGKRRYADLHIDAQRKSLIAVCEDHGVANGEPENSLIEITLADGKISALACGYDFYSSPRLSPDGRALAWLCWRHPNMPWDGTELWLAERGAGGALMNPKHVAGGEEESIFQPEWSAAGELYFVSDRSGWWNLYRLRNDNIEAVHPMAAEFGLPQWVFGLSTYAFAGRDQIVCSYAVHGVWRLGKIDLNSETLTEILSSFSDIGFLSADSSRVAFSAASPTDVDAVIEIDLASGNMETIRRASDAVIPAQNFSTPQGIEFATDNNVTSFGYFYPPHNPNFAAPNEERPPLIVISHGGPTSATTNALKLGIQYWTSRGFAVLDVNYGGSSGLGREYRGRLNGAWGVVDRADCVNGARHLVERGHVDGERLIIRGSSAGGYTTLCALTFADCFKAGASYYGVSDLTALAKDTHKFESRYLDRLVGPYPAAAAIYRERSPINYVDRLNAPVIFLQGLEDKVVPASQAETMVVALKRKGLPVAYIAFPGEQHGFRRSETLKRALDAELYFYAKVFGFNLPDTIESIAIDNLA